MRFMVLVKANKDSEAGKLPDEKALVEMGKFNEELIKAGVMLAGEGLHSSAKGRRIKFNAGGKPWAYISLGSKDNVKKDMRFNVVNNNEFLGYLIIQSTEPNNAAGVLEGPGVNKIKSGDQVKTQLQ